MKEGVTIRYKVDLILQLLDTTTGKSIDEKIVEFTKSGSDYTLIDRGNGNYIAVNTGREDFTLGIKVKGYVEKQHEIRYEELDEKLPIQTVFLIPEENNVKGGEILSFCGSLKGIESIEGVCVSRTLCSISAFDERKRIMTLFHPQGGLTLGDVYYGLIHGPESYERFEVVKEIPPSNVKIKQALVHEFSVNAPVSRVIFGQVDGDNFIFRIRNNSSKNVYMICYEIEGEKRFKLIDFSELDSLSLS